MLLDFVINYRLDRPFLGSHRIERLAVPVQNDTYASKDSLMLYFCGCMADSFDNCMFFKEVQLMAPYLERPLRIKYMVVLPSRDTLLLDAALRKGDVRRKLKSLHDRYKVATAVNSSNFAIRWAILLVQDVQHTINPLNSVYSARTFLVNDAIDYIGSSIPQ